jgi:hypothetical protein
MNVPGEIEMCFRKRIKASALLALGMAFLAIANIGHWWLQRHSGLPENTVDAWSGFLFGIAITTTLVAILRSRAP